MEVFGGIVVTAFCLFIAVKAGFATIKFHKPADKPSDGAGDKDAGDSKPEA